MPTLTIRQQQAFDATVSIDHAGDYPVTISNPFSPAEEQRLEWYFEEHLRFPFIEGKKAEAAAASVQEYGERLFNQLFAKRNAFSEYKEALRSGIDSLTIEIIGQPDFHQLHWEALKDPDLPNPFAIHANLVRRRPNPQTLRATLTPSPTINVLVVTARPSGSADVGYRTISRPLIETLRQTNLRVNIDLLRPGSYRALVRQLEAKPVGYYHVIHFDVHGALLDFGQLEHAMQQDQLFFRRRYGREEFKAYDGTRGYLALEAEKEGQADFVEAGELATLLITHQTPIVILNACQSGKQVGASETSLGARLMEAGVQTVLAMSYSVTVSAAEQLMGVFYRQLFDSQPLASSIRKARAELHRQKKRRGYYNQRLALEDWLLPVVYSVGESHNRSLRVSDDAQAVAVWWQRQAEIDAYRQLRRQPTYGFFGRDIDILTIERRLLAGDFAEPTGSQPSNVLLIQGMGGAGKSTLLHHLADWWRTTHLVDRVFYFGYDERAWTLQQMLHELARQLLDPNTLSSVFLPAPLGVQQSMIGQQLRSQRHLLLLDNLEAITGSPLAIPNTLPADEQKRLADFVAVLWGGRTLLLLGSRAPESWLLQRLGNPVYELGGLDAEAASALSDAILQRSLSSQRANAQREDEDLPRLLKLLAGYPLALEVVLPNLAKQSVAEVLKALKEGDIALDNVDGDKTQSILRCIDYSHSNLDPVEQQLLLCLAPFSVIINSELLPLYIEALKQQSFLAVLPLERLPIVVGHAKDTGLIATHFEVPILLQMQPFLHWFLRNRLNQNHNLQNAISNAFQKVYQEFAKQLVHFLDSNEPQEHQIGYALVKYEFENILFALDQSLTSYDSIEYLYRSLASYWDAEHKYSEGLSLGKMVIERLLQYPTAILEGMIGKELIGVWDHVANCYRLLNDFDSSEKEYLKALETLSSSRFADDEYLKQGRSHFLHQLGIIAKNQRHFVQAEHYYKEALEIDIELGNEESQAKTYHNLGVLASEQQDWKIARKYYEAALQIKIKVGNQKSRAMSFFNLAVVEINEQQYDQARKYLHVALDIFEMFDDPYWVASCYHNLGEILQQEHQWQQAHQHYVNALHIFIKLRANLPQAAIYQELGNLARELKQWQQAESYYSNALVILSAFDNQEHKRAGLYNQMGLLAQKQQHGEQAKEYFLKALQTYAIIGDQHHLSIPMRNLANLWKMTNDTTILTTIANLFDIPLDLVEMSLIMALG